MVGNNYNALNQEFIHIAALNTVVTKFATQRYKYITSTERESVVLQLDLIDEKRSRLLSFYCTFPSNLLF